MEMSDYEIVNSPEFIANVLTRGPAGDMLRLPRDRVKLRWEPTHPNVTRGSVVVLNNERDMVARWHPLGWRSGDEYGHYAHLHWIAPVHGEYFSWPIAKLREHERTGTGEVTASSWDYADGTPYSDVWEVIFDGKFDSPVQNRDRDRTPYRPPGGALCALWVGAWQTSPDARRTDLLPWRFKGSSSPPEPPTPPPSEVRLSDAEIMRVFRRFAELVN